LPEGLFRDTLYIPAGLLNDGRHRVEVQFHHYRSTPIHREHELLIFDVEDVLELRGEWWGKWQGAIRPSLPWRTELVEPADEADLVAIANASRR
jgi:lipopolysaccharide transport system ATP-binding protein